MCLHRVPSLLLVPTPTHHCHQDPLLSCGCCFPHPQSAHPAHSGDRERGGLIPWTLILKDLFPQDSPLVPTIPGSAWGIQRCC